MIEYKVYNKKYLIGDLHGSWGSIASHLVHNDEKKVAYLQVGDFLIGFNKIESEVDRLNQLNQILGDYESDLYIIRGNHDDPSWFNHDNYVDIKKNLNRIFFVPDYTVINMDLENILFVGGAISIDRESSKLDTTESWWEDEVFLLDENKIKSFENIERIITHTAPDFCPPHHVGELVHRYAEYDINLLDDLKSERSDMTKMASEIMFNGKNQLKSWYYGHFHSNYRLIHHNIEFMCIPINKFIQL